MIAPLKKAAKKIIAGSGYDIVNRRGLNSLRAELANARQKVARLEKKLDTLQNEIPRFAYLWNELNTEQRIAIGRHIPFSKSQLAQDLFVISELCSRPTSNFFVEFGATDGIALSNTFLLENQLGWNGILAEPASFWRDKLAGNRKCIIDYRCVSGESGKNVEFMEVLDDETKLASPELSSLAEYAFSGDWASQTRLSNSIKYTVETVSLNDLLLEHNAPQSIDYLSVDTEGSELEILENFDFKQYRVQIITVEHNYREPFRQRIFDLLTANGYARKHERVSMFDDWYVLSALS
jgi:FkbM family methyltransferase